MKGQLLMELKALRTIIFDCDGVLLNSNKIKTEAFYVAALPYGEDAAKALVDYHRQNGGISRFRKFNYFLEEIVSSGSEGPDLDGLLDVYKTEIENGLLSCQLAPKLKDLRDSTPDACWIIVSGGAEEELRELFCTRGIADYFDGGIYGSPKSKDEILRQLSDDNKLIAPSIFLGDTKYDHLASLKIGIEFIFINGWTEFSGWRKYCNQNGIESIKALDALLHKEYRLEEIEE